MRKKVAEGTVFFGLMAVPLFFGILTFIPAHAWAGLIEIPGMGYQVNATMSENLKNLMGKKVNVTLDSGTTFTGTVKAVGKGLLQLEKLESKEYFDALIRIDHISALDARFRDYQR